MPASNKNNMIEVKVNLSPAIYEFFKERSVQTGVSMKALYHLALETYVEQKLIMPHLPRMMEELREHESNPLNKKNV
jgi:hypothetical protein